MSETSAGIRVTRADGVVTVTLDNLGRKNAVTPDGFRRLRDVLRGVDRREDRVLLLTGAGDDFCAGADLGAHTDDTLHPYERMRIVGEVALTLHRLPIPTVASVRGVAVGAGMSLVLCCDLVVAATTARFSQIFTQRALSPDTGASWLLPQLIGLARAKELALLGEMVPATLAKEYGFVHRLAEPDEVDSVVQGLVETFRTGPTVALGLTKDLLNGAFDSSLEQAVEAEGKAVGINLATHDVREAGRAFREKRRPQFLGR
ncbi:enoyl-CoA hydratase-related protein [Georgenia ruanii]|uniref:Enoyl-CoA hydratase n=1 Tax=Georgenia ruanii TaxID=348442 RepID=A0A7J9UVY1_9MICO|nr:enoyl-CoA hydratase-related protein [Georgenia ruanii]MPV88523.1 enoyl-CoA hydratase [Georgenia ruanii]